MVSLRYALLCIVLCGGAWAQSNGAPAPGRQEPKFAATVTGVLEQDRAGPVLKAGAKTYRLATGDEEIRETLADKRVAGRTLKVEGDWKATGVFDVKRFFLVRDGKLYKLTYYCDICNITTYKPGPCMCCQKPVEPREVPYDPQGIY